MGKVWDGWESPAAFQRWNREWVAACMRVLKPGGHIVAFGGTRTWHRLAVAIEDAGFEMRDSLAWLYGSGFPKSMNVGKAIDKARDEDEGPRLAVTTWTREQCEARGWTRKRLCDAFGVKNQPIQSWTEKNPKNAIVPTWENWQKLKSLVGFGDDMDAEVRRLNGRKGQPGENWGRREVLSERETTFLARKKADGTTVSGDMLMASERGVATIRETLPTTDAAKQWSGWGTALKPAFEPIVLARKPFPGTVAANVLEHGVGAINVDACRIEGEPVRIENYQSRGPQGMMSHGHGGGSGHAGEERTVRISTSGRWPANVVLDQHAAAWVDEQSGVSVATRTAVSDDRGAGGSHIFASESLGRHDPSNSYADTGGASRFFYTAKAPKRERPNVNGVQHPTVKPLAIMQWLIRLVTPPGGTVLDPFAGSGTTIEAAIIEGFNPVGIEMEADYLPLIQHRINRNAEAIK